MIHIVIEKVNKLLAYPQKTFGGVVTKYLKCDYLSETNVLDLSLKSHCGHLCSSSKLFQVLHIIVHKLNELLGYRQRTLWWTYKKISEM